MNHFATFVKTFLVTTLFSLLVSTPVSAVEPDSDSAVSKNFQNVGRQMRGMRNIKTSADMLEALQTMRASAVANKDEVPSFMETGTEQYQEFQDGLDDFIGRLDEAIALAEAGDLDGANGLMQNIRGARNEYHEKFEIETD